MYYTHAGCRQASGHHHAHGRAFAYGMRRPKYNVPMNITEKEDGWEARIYASGFSKENIRITVSDDLLIVSGSRELSAEDEPKFTRQEFPVRNFERSIMLNGLIDTAAIGATQKDGVLIIHLPKTAEARVKEREITVS